MSPRTPKAEPVVTDEGNEAPEETPREPRALRPGDRVKVVNLAPEAAQTCPELIDAEGTVLGLLDPQEPFPVRVNVLGVSRVFAYSELELIA